jgi:alkylation response protein AidB-like acyl-CoA dehydrogenase
MLRSLFNLRRLPAGALRATGAALHTSTAAVARFAGFDLTDDQLEFQHVADTFAREELAPFSAQWDEKHIFPIDTLKKAAELGFAGLYVSEDVGGAGLSRLDAAIIFEALSWGCIPTAAYLSIHNMARQALAALDQDRGVSGASMPVPAGACAPRLADFQAAESMQRNSGCLAPHGPCPPQVASVIDKWGSPHLRGEYLPALTAMEARASYCLTEPGSGSDAASLKTTARREGDHYVLNGQKIFIR